MSGENWHEERDRLVKLLAGIEAGKVTHIDANDQRQLQSTNLANVEMLKMRLAELNARLAPKFRCWHLRRKRFGEGTSARVQACRRYGH